MTGSAVPTPTSCLAFDAASEAAETAEGYARAAGEFAALGDRRGAAYAVRCAAAALVAASDALLTIRPETDGGDR